MRAIVSECHRVVTLPCESAYVVGYKSRASGRSGARPPVFADTGSRQGRCGGRADAPRWCALQVIAFTWVRPRVLNTTQLQDMHVRLGDWLTKVESATQLMSQTAPELLVGH